MIGANVAKQILNMISGAYGAIHVPFELTKAKLSAIGEAIRRSD